MAKVLFRNVNVLDCTGAPPFTGQVLWKATESRRLRRRVQPLPPTAPVWWTVAARR